MPFGLHQEPAEPALHREGLGVLWAVLMGAPGPSRSSAPSALLSDVPINRAMTHLTDSMTLHKLTFHDVTLLPFKTGDMS